MNEGFGDGSDDEGYGGYRQESDQESDRDNDDDVELVATKDPYIVQGLEILSGNEDDLPQFLADVMRRPPTVFQAGGGIVTGVVAGIGNWANGCGANAVGAFGCTVVSDVDGQLAVKSRDGHWEIHPERKDDVKEAIAGAIWSAIRLTLQSDAAKPLGQSELLNSEMTVRGVTLRFTARVDDQRQQAVFKRVEQFHREIAGLNCARLAEQVFRSQRQLKAHALNAWNTTTDTNAPSGEMVEAKRRLFKRELRRDRLRLYLEAAQVALLHALASGKVMLVIDAAESKKAYGGASGNNVTNASHVMGHGILPQLTAQEMVRINLDATGLGGLKTTLAHEVAHIAGFNPEGMETSGHMAEVQDYVDNERGTGLPKLLFDAYFFETVYQCFINSD